MADRAPEMDEVTSLINMLNTLIIAAVDAIGDDGRIDAGEAVQLSMQGFQLVSAVIAMVTKKHDKAARERLRSAVENVVVAE